MFVHNLYFTGELKFSCSKVALSSKTMIFYEIKMGIGCSFSIH